MGYNINNYKRLGEPEEKENFEDYAKDFENSFPLYLLQKITKAYQRMIQTSFSWVMVKKIYFLKFSTLVLVWPMENCRLIMIELRSSKYLI